MIHRTLLPFQRLACALLLGSTLTTLTPDVAVAGWPYLTRTQFVEGSWGRVQSDGRIDLEVTFKKGLISVSANGALWAEYDFVDGWIMRFRLNKSDQRDIIFRVEKDGRNRMEWWRCDLHGKKLGDSPRLIWQRL